MVQRAITPQPYLIIKNPVQLFHLVRRQFPVGSRGVLANLVWRAGTGNHGTHGWRSQQPRERQLDHREASFFDEHFELIENVEVGFRKSPALCIWSERQPRVLWNSLVATVLAGQKSMCEWEEGQCAKSVFLGDRQYGSLNSTFEH